MTFQIVYSLRNIAELFHLLWGLQWGQGRWGTCYQEDKRYFSPIRKKRQKRSKNTVFFSHLCGENIKFMTCFVKILTVEYSGERPLNLSSVACPGNDIAHWKNVSLGRPEHPLPLALSTTGIPKCSDLRFLVVAIFHCRECRKQKPEEKTMVRVRRRKDRPVSIQTDSTVISQFSPHRPRGCPCAGH